tara:strand:+ start:119 stop:712 length:594 start_codon:yes stop_codon:yes gene_type:complete
MNFIKLKNPKTDLYLDFKNLILSSQFNWIYDGTVDPRLETPGDEYGGPMMYSHQLLARPASDILFSLPTSQQLETFNNVIVQIFNHNNFRWNDFSVMLRASVNAVNPRVGKVKYCIPHQDHQFPHKNMLIYLTDAGGSTFCEGEEYAPEEDDIVIFQGQHWHEIPKLKRRVVLVMTYISSNQKQTIDSRSMNIKNEI